MTSDEQKQGRFDDKDLNDESTDAAGEHAHHSEKHGHYDDSAHETAERKPGQEHNEATGHYDDSAHETAERKPGQEHNEATGHYDDKDQ